MENSPVLSDRAGLFFQGREDSSFGKRRTGLFYITEISAKKRKERIMEV